MSDDNQLFKKLLESIEQANDKQTKEIKEHIDKEVATLKIAIQEETEKRVKLETEHRELKTKYEILEKALRKNNIIIFGLQNNTEKSLLEFTTEELNKHLKINLTKQDINDVYEIGKQTHNKPIIVKLVSYVRKIEILKAAPQLKGTNISVAEQLTIEERKRNKILKYNLREARSKGLTAYIKHNKLYINNEEFTAEQLDDNEANVESESEHLEEAGKEQGPQTLQPILGKANIALTTINKRSFHSANENFSKGASDTEFHSKKRKVTQPVQHRCSPRLYDIEEKRKEKEGN